MTDHILEETRLLDGWFGVLDIRLRVGDDECRWRLIEHPSGAAVLPYDPARRVAMTVRQTRLAPLHLEKPGFPEAVAGVGGSEPPEETARREALEEVGLRLAQLDPVASVWVTPSSTTERVHLFLAPYAPGDRVADGGGLASENEQIEAREEPLAELWDLIGTGLVDAKLLMLLQALRIRRPELFAAA